MLANAVRANPQGVGGDAQLSGHGRAMIDLLLLLLLVILHLEYDNPAADPGVARMDGFENTGMLLIHVKSHTSALDKGCGESTVSIITRRENSRVASGLRRMDE